MLTPEQFMLLVQNLPEKDRKELERVWDEVFRKTTTQTDLGNAEKIRYAICTAYCQAMYDVVVSNEMKTLRERIIRV